MSEVRHEPDRGRFVIDLDGGEPAVLEYRRGDGSMDFFHTWVPIAHRGRGIAARLVRAGVDHARGEGLRVVPTCPYVDAWLQRNPDAARTGGR